MPGEHFGFEHFVGVEDVVLDLDPAVLVEILQRFGAHVIGPVVHLHHAFSGVRGRQHSDGTQRSGKAYRSIAISL
jgi:hypothetical protein